ncbi:voltage-gated potassium channel [Methanobacterium aggregans]|nr:voltage-gated potassium channel [Methanobacterium aggregans]
MAALIVADLVLITISDFSKVSASLLQDIIIFDTTLCFILFCEFIVRFRAADDKKSFIKKNWPDIIAMIPLEFLALRAFRFVRLVRVLRVVQLIRLGALLNKSSKNFFKFLKETKLDLSLGIIILAIISGTIFFFIFEHGTNNKIHSLWDSFFYVMPTILTAGSSNIVPQTIEGRIIGIVLVMIGLLFFGILAAAIASHFLEISENEEKIEVEDLKKSIEDLQSEIIDLKEVIKKSK